MSILNLYNRVLRSIVGRKKRYHTCLKAWLKKSVKKYRKMGPPKCHVWIIGCQRSGTTFFERVFRSDFNSSVFGEFSELTIHPRKTVLKPLDEIRSALSSCNARYTVVRPLFESDRVEEILKKMPNSQAIWLFRDCPHVVNSMIRKWGDQFFEISRQNETDGFGYWRLEQLVHEIDEELEPHASVDDKYALFWLKRNEMVFTKRLTADERIMYLNYQQLVNHTEYCIDTIMRKNGFNGVWKNFKTDVQVDSLNKSVSVSISSEIMVRCEDLYKRLGELSKLHFPEAPLC